MPQQVQDQNATKEVKSTTNNQVLKQTPSTDKWFQKDKLEWPPKEMVAKYGNGGAQKPLMAK